MDLQLIKKEEPVDYVLIATQQGQIINQQTFDKLPNGLIETEVLDVHIKQELDNGWSENEAQLSAYSDGMESEIPEIIQLIRYGHHSITEELSVVRSTKLSKSKKKKSKLKAQSYSRPKNYKCDECGIPFRTKSCLKTHTDKHEQSDIDLCTICNKFFSKSIIQFHIDSHDGPPYTCKICFKTFSIKRSWNHHRVVHDNDNAYECDVCGKCVKSKNSMLDHLMTHRDRTKVFRCELCQLSFFRKNTLDRHIKKRHGRVVYRCSNSLCDRAFIGRDSLESHKCKNIRRENLLKPRPKVPAKWKMTCDKCKKIFLKLECYVVHVAQNCSDRLLYECDYCSKMLSGKRNLCRHFKTCEKISELHRPKQEPCHICNRMFSSERKLSLHINKRRCIFQTEEERATCEKVYKCDYCSKSFSGKSHLLHHFGGHHKIDGLRRESCFLCNKTFLCKNALNRHQTKHHKSI